MNSNAGPTTAPVPTSCAFCGSGKIATTGKSTSVAAYWRCHTCGQIWNPARLVAPAPPRWR
jgi:hypothetical protein